MNTALSHIDSVYGFDQRAAHIYQRNLADDGFGSLTCAYPTIHSLLGEDLFSGLVLEYMDERSMQEFDWYQLDSDFPAWLRVHPVSDEYAYVADCAQLDWAIHICEQSGDSEIDFESFSMLGKVDSFQLKLDFSTGVVMVKSNFPIVDLYKADRNEVRDILRNGKNQVALVARKNSRAQVRAVNEKELYWLKLTEQSRSLGVALELSRKDYHTFHYWLPEAIEEGLVVGIKRI